MGNSALAKIEPGNSALSKAKAGNSALSKIEMGNSALVQIEAGARIYLSLARKNKASVPGPECAPITGST